MVVLRPYASYHEAKAFFNKVFPGHSLHFYVAYEYFLAIINEKLELEEIMKYPSYGTYILMDDEIVSILW